MALTKKAQAVKDRWLTALRSGKYKQGRFSLYNKKDKDFCCLGVLQHCTMNGKVEAHADNGVPRGTPTHEYFERNPHLQWVSDNMDRLIDLNDSEPGEGHKTFRGIATWIEKNWK